MPARLPADSVRRGCGSSPFAALNGAYVLRALDIDRVHFLPHPIQPYLVMSLRERQEDVLRSANREGGDEREAAAVHHLFDLPQECVLRLEPLRMLSPGVGGLDEERVAMDRTGPHTRSVVSVCKSPVNKVVSVPFTSYIVAPGMWPAGWAV